MPSADGDQKTCSKCNEIKHISAFSKESKHKDGLRSRCKSCRSLENRIRTDAYEARFGRRVHPSAALKINLLRRIAEAETCQMCGYSAFGGAMHWHHSQPDKKEFGLARAADHTWDAIWAELNKCICLCARCHMELEFGFRKLPASVVEDQTSDRAASNVPASYIQEQPCT